MKHTCPPLPHPPNGHFQKLHTFGTSIALDDILHSRNTFLEREGEKLSYVPRRRPETTRSNTVSNLSIVSCNGG